MLFRKWMGDISMRWAIATISSLLVIGLSSAVAQRPGPPPEIPEGSRLQQFLQQAGQNVADITETKKIQTRTDIPIELRAHYRRNHPELSRAARPGDPTGGFPMALESLWVWMRNNTDLQPNPSPPPSGPQVEVGVDPKVGVGERVRISGKQKSPRSESDIRVFAKNPKRIIAASNNIAAGGGSQAQFFTENGGLAWGQSYLPLQLEDTMQTDPTVGWTSDGTAWATTIGVNYGRTVLRLLSYKSRDGGKTWEFDQKISGDQDATDKQKMCVDGSDTSTYQDNIYLIWHNHGPAYVARRTGNGWHEPIQVSSAETTGTAIGGDITTNAAGEVFAAWPDTVSKTIFAVSSVDGGKTFRAPVPVAKTFGSYELFIPAMAERAALIQVSIAAFRDTTHNDVYVCWMDQSDDRDWKDRKNDPIHDANSTSKSRVWFTRSTDGGITWDGATLINAADEKDAKEKDAKKSNDQFNQALAVDPSTGSLGVIYYDTAQDPGRKRSHLMFRASGDRGAHWSTPATQVTETAIDETVVFADAGNQYGDYNGLSVVKGVFIPSWTNRRDEGSEEIYTARITVEKTAAGELGIALVKVPGGESNPK